jgi:formate-dependent nitrite reductase membrane component NrfD
MGVGAGEGPIPTYYDLPALKPTFYGWKVSSYIFIAGLAGSAQILAAIGEFADRKAYAGVVRNGRYIAFTGAAIGGPLLIADLHTPQRFYNMLRIFRPTSPMSIGSYVLVGFGGLSALLAAAQLRRDRGVAGGFLDGAARAAQLPAAALGAAMSTYTGALLGATSNPLWAAGHRLIPALFGASAMASAAAALSLTARGPSSAALQRVEAAASAVELCLLPMLGARLRTAGIRTAVSPTPSMLAAAAPVLHQIAGAIESPRAGRDGPPVSSPAAARRSAAFGKAAAIAVLAGAFLLRHAVLQAGNRSAQRPRDHFRFARPQ